MSLVGLTIFQIALLGATSLGSAEWVCHNRLTEEKCCYPNEDYWNATEEIGGDCIYKYLVESNYRRDLGRHEAAASVTAAVKKRQLRNIPPPGNTVVAVRRVILQYVDMDEDRQTFTMAGLFLTSWSDSRLIWNSSVTQRSTLWWNEGQFWKPKIGAETAGSGWGSVSNVGKVYWYMQYAAGAQCSFDYTYFPYDEHECCTSFKASVLQVQSLDSSIASSVTFRQFEDISPDNRVDSLTRLWGITGLKFSNSTSTETKEGPYGPTITYKLCITVKRRSATAVNEFVMPLTVATLLTIVLPFLGSWNVQIASKIFCLCLLYGCLFTVVLETDQLQFGETTPALLRFYDFVIWTTAVNLLFTMLLWNLSKRTIGHPTSPPQSLTVLCQRINSIVWCSKWKESVNPLEKLIRNRLLHMEASDNPSSISATTQMQTIRNEEWSNMWRGLNTMVGIAFTVIYIIGALAILA